MVDKYAEEADQGFPPEGGRRGEIGHPPENAPTLTSPKSPKQQRSLDPRKGNRPPKYAEEADQGFPPEGGRRGEREEEMTGKLATPRKCPQASSQAQKVQGNCPKKSKAGEIL